MSGMRAPMFSKCGMPSTSSVRRNIAKSQRGLSALSQARRSVGRSGRLKPLRALFSRFALTGTSTVRTSVSKPARATRSRRRVIGPVSPGR